MSATRLRLGPGSLLLLLSLGVGLDLAGLLTAGVEPQVPEGVVRVQFRRKLPGVFQGEKIIPQATVVEVTEYSGAVIDSRGYIASYIGSSWVDMGNASPDVFVRLSDGKFVPAKLVGVDERISLAVLHADAVAGRSAVLGRPAAKESVRFAYWDSLRGDEPPEPIVLLGSRPQAQKQVDGVGHWALAEGRVLDSVAGGLDSVATMKIKLDGDQPGPPEQAWGGAVVLDGANRFLGFITRVENSGLSRTFRAVHLLPVDVARKSLKEVVDRKQSIRAGWLGIWMSDEPDQVRIEKVISGEPAERAGIRAGDVIIKFDNTAIWSRDQFVRLLRSLTPDTRVDLTVERDGRPQTLSAVLGAWPASERPRFAWSIQVPDVWTSENGASAEAKEVRIFKVPLDPPASLGLLVDPLTPQLAQYFKVPSGKGLLVKSVIDGSPASRFGFRAGDVLTRINDQEVESASDIRRIVDLSRNGVLVISFFRDGVRMTRKVALH